MGNNRHRNRLSIILSPSTLLASHAKPSPISPDPVPISPKEGLRPGRVKSQRGSLRLLFFPPTINQTTSDLPPPTSSRTSGGLEPLMSQPPREKPPRAQDSSARHPSRSRHHTTPNRDKRAGCIFPAAEPTPPSLATTSRPNNEGTRRRGPVPEPTKPKQPSKDAYPPTPTSSLDLQRSTRTPYKQATPKRRASVDVISAGDRIALTGSVEPKQTTLLRSRSLWTNRKGSVVIGDDRQDGETRLRGVNPLSEPLQKPMTEKQRAMNVRRAKKMQQVFGSEPPQALFQITHLNPISDEGYDTPKGSEKGGSTSTLLSVSTTNLLSPHSLSRRQRTVSISSTTIAPTPPLTPTTPIPPQSETPTPVSSRPEQSFPVNPPRTPPPFSNMFPINPPTSAATPGTSKNTARPETTGRRRETDFKQRRMRAAKLSKFFGVGYQDLEPHLVPGNRTDVQTLEVAIDDRGGLFRHEVRPLDMEDVIVRLRDLRSS